MRDFDCDYPGPVSSSWWLRPGRPSGPSSRAGFPLRPRRLGGPGSAMNPVDPLSSPPGACSSRAPGCGGNFCPLPCGFSGSGGVCRLSALRRPGVARGPWPHASPRSVGCPRGGNEGWLRWGASCYWAAVADSVVVRHPLSSSGVPLVYSSSRRDRAAAPSFPAGLWAPGILWPGLYPFGRSPGVSRSGAALRRPWPGLRQWCLAPRIALSGAPGSLARQIPWCLLAAGGCGRVPTMVPVVGWSGRD